MRTIAVVTVGRSDYGIYLPVLQAMRADPALDPRLLVSGSHLSPEFGLTIRQIEADGFPIHDRIEMLLSSDTPEGIAKSMGLGTLGFAQAYARSRPDLLLVLGDRFEMHAAAVAALPFKIPVAHIHGGELTQGAIDDALRHSLTKLSHLHFVSTQQYADRVMQLGEEPWRIVVSGAPSLDNLHTLQRLTVAELEAQYNLRLDTAPLLVTFHPTTLEYEQAAFQIDELLSALAEVAMPVIFTLPNADTNGRVIIQKITDFVQSTTACQMVDNLGTQGYFSLMGHAAAMVGNSSSGIIEAASFKLPVVNIGNRQKGRVRARNVIDTGYDRREIVAGIRRALDSTFNASLDELVNPYGTGQAAHTIVQTLKTVPLGNTLIQKSFVDWPH